MPIEMPIGNDSLYRYMAMQAAPAYHDTNLRPCVVFEELCGA